MSSTQPHLTYAVPASQVPAGPTTVRTYRRQSVTVHLVLALTTAGIGNWVYAKFVNLSNKYRR